MISQDTAPTTVPYGTRPLWSACHVAAHLALTRKCVYGLVARGVLPVIRVGNRLRFDPDDIRDWLRRNRKVG